MKKIFGLFLLCVSFSWAGISFASGDTHPLADVDIPQDEASIKRGLMVYYDSCRMCHSMKYIQYRGLADIGLSDTEISNLRGDKPLSDRFSSTTTDETANDLFGMVPPDLSLMAKARKQGPRYIYTLLTSYYEKSEGVYENKHFPGIKMPDVFAYSVALNAEEKSVIENKVKDITSFLLWASDPRAKERKSLGVYVIGYLVILSAMFYFLMKRVWARLDDEDESAVGCRSTDSV